MNILKNPDTSDSYLFHLRDEAITINFLLRQITYFRKDSPFFEIIFLNDWSHLEDTEVSDLTIIKRAKLLVRHLQIKIDDKLEVFNNIDDPSCFLLITGGKFIQVDTKFKSLSDESDSLFLSNTYKLDKPEAKNTMAIDAYNEIFKNIINSLGVNERIFC